jgi:hypothetical protein
MWCRPRYAEAEAEPQVAKGDTNTKEVRREPPPVQREQSRAAVEPCSHTSWSETDCMGAMRGKSGKSGRRRRTSRAFANRAPPCAGVTTYRCASTPPHDVLGIPRVEGPAEVRRAALLTARGRAWAQKEEKEANFLRATEAPHPDDDPVEAAVASAHAHTHASTPVDASTEALLLEVTKSSESGLYFSKTAEAPPMEDAEQDAEQDDPKTAEFPPMEDAKQNAEQQEEEEEAGEAAVVEEAKGAAQEEHNVVGMENIEKAIFLSLLIAGGLAFFLMIVVLVGTPHFTGTRTTSRWSLAHACVSQPTQISATLLHLCYMGR